MHIEMGSGEGHVFDAADCFKILVAGNVLAERLFGVLLVYRRRCSKLVCGWEAKHPRAPV